MFVIKFNKDYDGIVFDIDIQDKVNLFMGNSGTGKTFAFNTIYKYLVSNNVDVIYFSHKQSDYTVEHIMSLCNDNKIIIMDDADLYMTKKLFNYLKSNCGQVLISIKDIEKLTTYEKCGFYGVVYEGNILKTVRENIGLAI